MVFPWLSVVVIITAVLGRKGDGVFVVVPWPLTSVDVVGLLLAGVDGVGLLLTGVGVGLLLTGVDGVGLLLTGVVGGGLLLLAGVVTTGP